MEEKIYTGQKKYICKDGTEEAINSTNESNNMKPMTVILMIIAISLLYALIFGIVQALLMLVGGMTGGLMGGWLYHKLNNRD